MGRAIEAFTYCRLGLPVGIVSELEGESSVREDVHEPCQILELWT